MIMDYNTHFENNLYYKNDFTTGWMYYMAYTSHAYVHTIYFDI